MLLQRLPNSRPRCYCFTAAAQHQLEERVDALRAVLDAPGSKRAAFEGWASRRQRSHPKGIERETSMRGMTMKTANKMLLVSAFRLTTTLLGGVVLILAGCATPPGISPSTDSSTGTMKTFGQ